MGSLSLGRPKWGGITWAKGAQEGRAPWGGFQEASRLPPWRNPREGNPRAQPLGLPPPPINRGGGGTPSRYNSDFSWQKGCPLSLPLIRSNLHPPEGLLLPPLYSG